MVTHGGAGGVGQPGVGVVGLEVAGTRRGRRGGHSPEGSEQVAGIHLGEGGEL